MFALFSARGPQQKTRQWKQLSAKMGILMEDCVVVLDISYFHPYLEKIPILTNIFQLGWNHQPEDWVVVPNIFFEFSSLFVEMIQFEELLFQRGCRKSEYLWVLVISRLAWIENFFEIMQHPLRIMGSPNWWSWSLWSRNPAIQSRDAPLFWEGPMNVRVINWLGV